MLRRAFMCLVAVACAMGGACERPAPTTPIVVVSVLPQAYFVERIAGDLVETHVMIPPGASPTTYEPNHDQLKAAADASVYFKVGHPNFPFERAWLDRLIGDSTRVVDASAGVARRDGDPHVWVSPACARTMSTNIGAAMIELLPAHQATIEANLDAFVSEIDELDRELRTLFEPCRGETFFVAHAAWGYLADDYELTQASIERDGKTPSPRVIAELVEAAKASGAKAIFVQPQFPRNSAEIVAEETGAAIIVADPLAPDWLGSTREVARALAAALTERP